MKTHGHWQTTISKILKTESTVARQAHFTTSIKVKTERNKVYRKREQNR